MLFIFENGHVNIDLELSTLFLEKDYKIFYR